MIASWIAALRSGMYRQGRTYLRTVDSYCCLGVLCEVAGVKGVFNRDMGCYEYDGCIGGLPLSLHGLFRDKSVMKRLIEMNDIERRSFEEIATFLEETWALKPV